MSIVRATIATLTKRHSGPKLPLRIYQFANNAYPMVTKGVTGGMLGGLGDLVAQYLEAGRYSSTRSDAVSRQYVETDGRHLADCDTTIASSPVSLSTLLLSTSSSPLPFEPWEGFSWRRLAAFATFNGIWAGAPLHFYIQFLEKRSGFGLLRKLLVTHAVYNPVVYFPSFYLCHGLLMGHDLPLIAQRVRCEMPHAFAQCLQFWVPVNIVQFTAVRPSAQVAFLSVCNVAWSAILSSSTGGNF
ncbi:unnamed protein product [Amoebophrya sp. A25]|nr:unnamed protein product [Amoebophrya sp. A25]|eukprot:GSA25T00014828001.1